LADTLGWLQDWANKREERHSVGKEDNDEVEAINSIIPPKQD